MSPSINDLRNTLESGATADPTPDPYAVLSGAKTRATAMRRQRTTAGWIAAAAAVLAIGGTTMLLSNGTESLGDIEPAVPDSSYTDGYGIIDGVPQPFMDGLRLLSVTTVEPGRSQSIEATDAYSGAQLYAVALCTPPSEGEPGVFLEALGESAGVECLDPDGEVDDSGEAVTLAPHEGAYVASNRTIEPARVVLYAEASWSEYPFPTVDNDPSFAPDPGGIVIDRNTPPSTSKGIDAIPNGSRVFEARVPISSEPSQLLVIMAAPGQVMVAIDGVVVTDDNEGLNADSTLEDEFAWMTSEPGLRDGFVTSFGLLSGWSTYIDESSFERLGIDTSDGAVNVTVFPQGFVDDSSWRVTFAQAAAVTDDAATDRELTAMDTDLPEFVHGHRRVATFEVPTDGAPHPIPKALREADDLTWVSDCPDPALDEQGTFRPEIGTVRTPTGSGQLMCFVGGDGWSNALRPAAFTESSGSGTSTTLTARSSDVVDTQVVSAYEPMEFDDFPFDDAADVESFEPVTDGETFGSGDDEMTYRQTMQVTASDLDSDGTVILEVPASSFTEFYVTTEGIGRFWLEPSNGDGESVTPRGEANANVSAYGADDYWTSWTDATTSWAIAAQGDSGASPKQVRLRVQGYDEGSFELQVFGLYPSDKQP